MDIIVRKAVSDDIDGITEIYNDSVLNSIATFDTESKDIDEQRRWFEYHDQRHPILVAEENGKVSGWICLSEWCDRQAYSDTAELSIYVHQDMRGRGIGRKLIEAVIHEARSIKLHVIIARIETSNKIIIHLLKIFGFKQIGVMKEVGFKFGKLLDVLIMQLVL